MWWRFKTPKPCGLFGTQGWTLRHVLELRQLHRKEWDTKYENKGHWLSYTKGMLRHFALASSCNIS
jgi:hypothetical protein